MLSVAWKHDIDLLPSQVAKQIHNFIFFEKSLKHTCRFPGRQFSSLNEEFTEFTDIM